MPPMTSTSRSSLWADRLKALDKLLPQASPEDRSRLLAVKELFRKGDAAARKADELRAAKPSSPAPKGSPTGN